MVLLKGSICAMLVFLCCSGALSQPISLLECPESSGSELVLLADPSDCSGYYICDHGQPIHLNCPAGLNFNPALNVCDFPDNVDCTTVPTELSTTTTPTSAPYNNLTTTSPVQNSMAMSTINSLSTTDVYNSTSVSYVKKGLVKLVNLPVFPECPSTSGSELVLLPNPYDCGSYYMCTNGSPIQMQCPAGLYFNLRLQVCDYPRYIDCIPVNFTTPPSPSQNVTTPEYSTYQPINNTTTYAPGNTTVVPISSKTSEAPEITTTLTPYNTTNVILETSTTSVISENGTTIVSPIVNTTVPANSTSPPNSPSNTTGSSNSVVTAPPAIASQCPTFSPIVPSTHLANPEDCSSFYTCVADNTAFLQYCQTGLQFNAPLQICDFPHNVDC